MMLMRAVLGEEEEGRGEMGENASKSFLVVQYIPQESVSTVAS